MGIFARAWKSILRQPVKSLILLVTVAVLGTLIAGAVSIKQGIITTQMSVADKIPITASIKLKDVKTTLSYLTAEDLMALPFLDSGKIEQITSLPQVKTYELIKTKGLSSSKLLSKTGVGLQSMPIDVISVESGKLLDYEQGNLTIVSGRWLTPEDENSNQNPIVIPDALAKKNNISVGSKLTLDSIAVDMSTAPPDLKTQVHEVTFTVIGMFTPADKYLLTPEGDYISMSKLLIDKSYVPKNTLEPIINDYAQMNIEINQKGNALRVTSMIPTLNIWLKNREGAEDFADAVNAIGLPKEYEVTVSTEAYDKTLTPLKNLDWIANLIIAASVAATIAILGLVITLVLKSRGVEIGILFTLGEKKKNIAAQMVAEVLMIAVIGLSVSVLAGTKLSEGISNQLIKGGVKNFVETTASDGYNFDATALQSISEGAKITLGADTVALIYLVGLLTTGAASVIPVVLTLRQSPKKILLN